MSFLLSKDKRLADESAVDFILRNLKNSIMGGEVKPGDRLPSEGELCQAFEVGRGTVREAMKILAATGVVVVKRGDGTYVSDIASKSLVEPLLMKMCCSSHTIQDIVQLREMLEFAVVELIIRNADNEGIDKLERINNRLREKLSESLDSAEACRLDIEYHRCMGECTKNSLIRILYEFAIDFLEGSIGNLYRNSPAVIMQSPVHHDRMIKAMRTKNVEMARQSIRIAMEGFVSGMSQKEQNGR